MPVKFQREQKNPKDRSYSTNPWCRNDWYFFF